MPLIHLPDMLGHAYRHQYAVGAFDLVSLDFLSGILSAAENCHAPVILSLAESHFEHYDFELLMAACVVAAHRTPVPVAIHLDHGAGTETAVRAIRAGCNGVMVDASFLPLEENLKRTQEVVAMAHACGVAVEGELGYVPGVEGEDAKRHPGEVAYTLPAEAKDFVARSGVDCLAVSVGTVHGRMQGKPRLDIERLGKINEAVGIPLVIHGGTGLSDDQFGKLIANGVAKINYYTALADVAGASVRERLVSFPDGSYTRLTADVSDAVRGEAERMIRLWGGAGRATDVLAQCRLWQEVVHVVLYNLDYDPDEIAPSMLVAQGKKQLAEIPGVRTVAHGTTAREDAPYRYCWLIRFAGDAVIASYRDHPGHLRYADEVFRPAAPDRLTIDFEMDARP